MNKTGTLFILAAPSGAGKTSLVKALLREVENLSFSVSHTTRKARADEHDGESYYFVDKSEFKRLIKQDYFLEHALVFENYYGTSKAWVEKELAAGKNIILEIDWQGMRQVYSRLRNGVSVFILPPSYEALRERLISRQNDDQETIEKRMDAAKKEISYYKEFDYVVINNQFEQALAEIKAIITASNLGKCRQAGYFDHFVQQIMAQRS